jgi:FixJ family two-component response regulator
MVEKQQRKDDVTECDQWVTWRSESHSERRAACQSDVNTGDSNTALRALVSAGMLNKLIAAKLRINEITVKAHRGNVMRKMQAQSLPDLVTMAESLGVRLRAR